MVHTYSDKVYLGVSPKWEIDFLHFSLLSLSEAN